MSAAITVLDTEHVVERLRKDGVSDTQAYAIARLLADVQQPGFDRELACVDLVRAGFSPEKTDRLINDALLMADKLRQP